MGEISDMMLEGILCQECGQYVDYHTGESRACGYPRFCPDCGGDPETNYASKRKECIAKQCRCPTCKRRFRTRRGLHDHIRDKHGEGKSDE